MVPPLFSSQEYVYRYVAHASLFLSLSNPHRFSPFFVQ
jgi:hypothetical protein